MTEEKGFTLVELLVALFVAGIVMTAVYSAYSSQQKSYTIQEQMAEMQQNLRSAMFMMTREIRMAGCNPSGTADTAGFQSLASNGVIFSMDVKGSAPGSSYDGDTGDPDEFIEYSLADWNGDGINDLMRTTPPTGIAPIAENIDALNIVYLDANDVVTADLLSVRSVQITLVTRTSGSDPHYTNTTAYRNLQGNIIYTAPGDGFRRRALSTHVKCRNMGLH